MRKLRRLPKAGFPAARAAVVVPNGTLFGDGVCARIKLVQDILAKERRIMEIMPEIAVMLKKGDGEGRGRDG